MTVDDFTNHIDGCINDFTTGVVDEIEFRNMIVDFLTDEFSPALKQLKDLAEQVKQARHTQNLYFASRKENRFGDKMILAESKRLESQLDTTVNDILNQY